MSKKEESNLPAVRQDLAAMLATAPDIPAELEGQGAAQLEQSAQERFPQLFVAQFQTDAEVLEQVGGPGVVYTIHGSGDIRECEVIAQYGIENGFDATIVYHFQRYEKWYDRKDKAQLYPIAQSTPAVPASPLYEFVTDPQQREETYGAGMKYRYHHAFYFWIEIQTGPAKGRRFLISMKGGSIKFAKAIANQMKRFNDARKAQGRPTLPIYAPRWRFYSQKALSANNEPFMAFGAEVAQPAWNSPEEIQRLAEAHSEVAAAFESYGSGQTPVAEPDVPE